MQKKVYDWNDIVIVGDSFCSSRYRDYHWPQILACTLTNQIFDSNRIPRGRGFPGASWWSTRKCIIDELSNKSPAKILIVCHTESNRIPSDNDYSLNCVSVEHRWLHRERGGNDLMTERMALAGQLYYKELISWDFNEWAVKRWYFELEEIIDRHPTIEKSIHLFCFDGNFHKFRNGVSIEDTLFKHRSKKEVANHFDIAGNQQLAKNLKNILDNYPGPGQCYSNLILEE